MEKKIELTREQLIKMLHSAAGNVKYFVTNEQEWINEQLSMYGVINCAYSDETLLKGFKALFGNEWKKTWNDASKVHEMKSIIDGGTMPCVSFKNWKNCIDILNQ